MASPNPPPWSLTSHLLSVDKQVYEAATRAPFLAAAGQGRTSKTTLGKWLANDRLYTHAYIKAAGRALALIDLPQTAATAAAAWTPPLVDWLCETLMALRREDRLFIDVARRYNIPIDLEVEEEQQQEQQTGVEGRFPRVRDAAKIPGLIMFERLFAILRVPMEDEDNNNHSNTRLLLPWLEAAVVFWGTERVYSDAWTWAKEQQQQREGAKLSEEEDEDDADGGALRKEFIPNWSSDEFVAFVGTLGGIVDGAVVGLVEVHGEAVKASLVARAERVWRELVAAEAAFWPNVE